MNKRFFAYALAVTVITTILCWVNMFDSARNSGGFRSGYGSGGSTYSGGGHK
ncbi:hypothetical protein [Massilia niastensis]|uniref:hypothetical protein n=1 Tax=Massilia niastensis TaxID=544911 RepID=UPI00035C45B0|nr:hypothetical protein [Massilia niastensis]